MRAARLLGREERFHGRSVRQLHDVDTATNRVFTLDCYVYSPKNHKRNYMRELEHLLYLISVPDKTPADE